MNKSQRLQRLTRNSRKRRMLLLMGTVMLSLSLLGCMGGSNRVVIMRPGTPGVLLEEVPRAKIGTAGADGKLVVGEGSLPVGTLIEAPKR